MYAYVYVYLHKDISTLNVPMSNAGFSLRAKNARMEMDQPSSGGVGHKQHLSTIDITTYEIIVKRSFAMVLRDEPQLSTRSSRRHIASKEAQNVFVAQEDRIVDLRLSNPRRLVARVEYFDSHRRALE